MFDIGDENVGVFFDEFIVEVGKCLVVMFL